MGRSRKGEEGGDKDDDDIAEDEIDEGSEKDKGEEVNELWNVIRVIPMDQKVECRMDGCKCQAVAIWGSNIDPEDKWSMCEECQLKEYGGWPDGVDPIKHSTTSNNNDRVNDDDDDNDDESKTKTVTTTLPLRAVATSSTWSAESTKQQQKGIIIGIIRT